MKTFKEYFEEDFAYATGRWKDFAILDLVYNDKTMRIYSGIRMGEVIFETQIKIASKWQTVQYSTTMEEALNPKKRSAPYTREQIIDRQKRQPWYQRARERGYTDNDIFGQEEIENI